MHGNPFVIEVGYRVDVGDRVVLLMHGIRFRRAKSSPTKLALLPLSLSG